MEHRDRHKSLLKLLAEHGAASVLDLADWLDVSPSTIRRDLRLLGTAGQIERVRGGGQRVGVRRAEASTGGFHRDADCHAQRKHAIARVAASLCRDGETIMIGGGTTTAAMPAFLAERCMRVLTNSFEVARRLLATSDNEVILSGGTVHADQNVILSPFGSEAIQYCYADKLFLGTQGLSAFGLMESDSLLVQAGRRLIGQAQQVIVLADSSKFGHRAGMLLCGLDKVARVVTDTDAPDAVVQMLERAGVQVTLVPCESPPAQDWRPLSQATH